jgi:hypothetical protein
MSSGMFKIGSWIVDEDERKEIENGEEASKQVRR